MVTLKTCEERETHRNLKIDLNFEGNKAVLRLIANGKKDGTGAIEYARIELRKQEQEYLQTKLAFPDLFAPSLEMFL